MKLKEKYKNMSIQDICLETSDIAAECMYVFAEDNENIAIFLSLYTVKYTRALLQELQEGGEDEKED